MFQALVVISVANPPDWRHVVGTTGNEMQYVTSDGRRSGDSSNGDDGGIGGRRPRREAVAEISAAMAAEQMNGVTETSDRIGDGNDGGQFVVAG